MFDMECLYATPDYMHTIPADQIAFSSGFCGFVLGSRSAGKCVDNEKENGHYRDRRAYIGV